MNRVPVPNKSLGMLGHTGHRGVRHHLKAQLLPIEAARRWIDGWRGGWKSKKKATERMADRPHQQESYAADPNENPKKQQQHFIDASIDTTSQANSVPTLSSSNKHQTQMQPIVDRSCSCGGCPPASLARRRGAHCSVCIHGNAALGLLVCSLRGGSLHPFWRPRTATVVALAMVVASAVASTMGSRTTRHVFCCLN